jgi:hypothetical protein
MAVGMVPQMVDKKDVKKVAWWDKKRAVLMAEQKAVR